MIVHMIGGSGGLDLKSVIHSRRSRLLLGGTAATAKRGRSSGCSVRTVRWNWFVARSSASVSIALMASIDIFLARCALR